MEQKSEWRCLKCGLLLGTKQTGRFEFVYKRSIRYVFHGKGVFTTNCRKCGTLNDVNVE